MYRHLLLISLLALSTLCFGQEYNISVQHYTVEDGLSDRVVNQAAKDDRGFIWVATKKGLDRFDGTEFRSFFPEHFSDGVSSVLRDPNGLIWVIGPARGFEETHDIMILDPMKETLSRLAEVYPFTKEFSFHALSHCISTDTELILGGTRSSMLLFDGDTIVEIDVPGFTVHQPITWSRRHGYYVFSDIYNGKSMTGHIYRYAQNDTIKYGPLNLGNFVERGCMGVGKNGELRYTAGHPGTLDITDHILEFKDDSISFMPTLISDLITDSVPRFSDLMFRHNPFNDETWLLYGNLLNIYDQDFRLIFSGPVSEDEKLSQRAMTVYFQNENVAWVCGIKGLARISTSKERIRHSFTSKQTGPLSMRWGSNACRQIVELDSIIILATDNGIVKIMEDGSYSYLTDVDRVSLGFQVFGDTMFYSEKNLFMWQNLRTGEKKVLTKRPHILHNDPWSFNRKTASNFLVTGASVIDLDFETGYYKDHVPEHNHDHAVGQIYQIFKHQGTDYLATEDGLYEFEPEVLDSGDVFLRSDLPLPSRHVFSIQKANGFNWICTADFGLVQWNPVNDSLRFFDRSSGLPSKVIYGLLDDEDGNLWISTDNGLSRFDPNTETFKNYGVSDGLSDAEFNRISFHKGKSGKLYFGSVDGLNIIEPSRFSNDSVLNDIPLAITGLTQDISDSGKVVNMLPDFLESGVVRLGPFDRFFIAEFKLLDFKPAKNSYAFKIIGVDSDWNYIAQNSIRVGGLDGGRHEVHIKGQLGDGTWSKNKLVIPVIVEVPFYKRLWFLILSVMSIIIGIIIFIRWRTNVLRKRTQQLESTVAERTAELDTSLKQKEILLKEIHHRVKNNLQIISSFIELETMGIEDEKTKQVLKQGRNRVKAMALIHKNLYQKDDLGHIQMQEYTQELLTAIMNGFSGTSNKVDLNINMNGIDLDIDTAIPLGLILTELVTNSFKYAFDDVEKGQIDISLEGSDDRYRMVMKDNGIGFPEEMKRRKGSLGLTLVDMLSEQMDGDVTYENENGAKITLYFTGIETRKLQD